VALDERRAKEVRLSAAVAAHKMTASSQMLQRRIFTSGLYQSMLAALDDLAMNLRFHIGMTILAIASICDETTYRSYLEPEYCATTFYEATSLLLEMENSHIFNGLLDAWDLLFSLGDASVVDQFLALFPGDLLWTEFASDDSELGPKAGAFLSKWFRE
jgi:hypothetical protein